MTDESGSRRLTAFRCLILVLFSFGALSGGIFLGSKLEGLPRLLCGLAGFGGYVALFSAALRQLPVDWNMWQDRSLEEFRSKAKRSKGTRGRAAGETSGA